VHAIREAWRGFPDDLDRETRLADASGTNERDQAGLALIEERAQLGSLGVSPDQGSQRYRQRAIPLPLATGMRNKHDRGSRRGRKIGGRRIEH
jgi:hypothetical protein